jgi:hypothetical protein
MSPVNKVCCFYIELTKTEKTRGFTQQCVELIDYWKKSWQKYGWDTHVLTEDYVKDDKSYFDLKFDAFYDSILCKHTIDFDCEYSRACYLRWLAYRKFAEQNGPIFWCDYDVINYGIDTNNDIQVNHRLLGCSSAGKLDIDGGNKIVNEFVKVQNGEYDISKLSKKINTHPDEKLKNKISDLFITASLVRLPIHKPLLMFEPQHIETHNAKLPFLVHYHNGIFAEHNKVSNLLHINGVRYSRLKAISILEKHNNIPHH